MFRTVSAELDFVALEEAEFARWEDAPRLRALRVPARGRRALDLLRGPAYGERQTRPPPCVGAGLQGPLLPLPDDAGPLVPRTRGLGHPRPPRRGPGREAARHLGQAGDRGEGGHGGFHRAVSRLGPHLRRGVRQAHRPDRLLGRHGTRLLDVPSHLRRLGLVAPRSRSSTRASSTRTSRSCRTARGARRRCRATSSGSPSLHDEVDQSAFVRLPIAASTLDDAPDGASTCGWTTTPWTLLAQCGGRGEPRAHLRGRGRHGRGGRDLVESVFGDGVRPSDIPGERARRRALRASLHRPCDHRRRRRVLRGSGGLRHDRRRHRSRAPGAGLW